MGGDVALRWALDPHVVGEIAELGEVVRRADPDPFPTYYGHPNASPRALRFEPPQLHQKSA